MNVGGGGGGTSSGGSGAGNQPNGYLWTSPTAAAVHGQLNAQDEPMRKPMRLESLAQPSAGRSKKKRRQENIMEQY